MSGGDMTLDDCAFSQVMTAKGKLREWIANIVTSGDLFERDGEEEIAAEPPQDVAIENYELIMNRHWSHSSQKKR